VLVLQDVPATLPSADAPGPPPQDRRQTGRLNTPVNFVVRRMGTNGAVLQEELTFAENIGRGGACVPTTMSSLVIGDFINVAEIGGDFKTRAEVRGAYVGKDNTRRLNLRFVDTPAPDRLVRTDSGALLVRAGGGTTPVSTATPTPDRRRRY
jgi:hypothetical protein